jgi:hypothetical protein
VSVLRLKILLARSTNGANPIIGNGFEGCSSGDPAVRIPFGRIIDVATDSTNIFLHLTALFLMKYGLSDLWIIAYALYFSRADTPIPRVVCCKNKPGRGLKRKRLFLKTFLQQPQCFNQ